MKNIEKKETEKKIKVYLFESALLESTDVERLLYEHEVDYFEKNLPEKVREALDDNAVINLFFAEHWEEIKKEFPFTFRIFNDYLDRIAVCLNYDLNRMESGLPNRKRNS